MEEEFLITEIIVLIFIFYIFTSYLFYLVKIHNKLTEVWFSIINNIRIANNTLN